MKQIVFALYLLLTSVVSRSQTLTVTNNTNCDVVFQVYAIDVNSPPGCIDYFTTYATSLPANTGPTAYNVLTSFSWVGGSTPTTNSGLQCNAYVVDYDATTLSTCFNSTGYLIGKAIAGTIHSSGLAIVLLVVPACRPVGDKRGLFLGYC